MITDRLIKKLKAEPDFYYSWQANIAMAFKDEFSRKSGEIAAAKVHDMANDAAKNFLNLLIRGIPKTGVELIAEERNEQIEKHGRTLEWDDARNVGEQLATAAEMLLAVSHEEGIDSESFPEGWDRDTCEHMISKPYKERLIIAGALIAAEIDRLQYEPDQYHEEQPEE